MLCIVAKQYVLWEKCLNKWIGSAPRIMILQITTINCLHQLLKLPPFEPQMLVPSGEYIKTYCDQANWRNFHVWILHGCSRQCRTIGSFWSTAGLKAPERIAFKYGVLVYKCFHGSAPAYLTDQLCQVADVEARQRLRSSSSLSLIVSRTRLSTVGDQAFLVAAARVWNSLPDLVTSAPSIAVFRSGLKTHLFNISYPSPCDCTVPVQWRLVALDAIIVLPYLLT